MGLREDLWFRFFKETRRGTQQGHIVFIVFIVFSYYFSLWNTMKHYKTLWRIVFIVFLIAVGLWHLKHSYNKIEFQSSNFERKVLLRSTECVIEKDSYNTRYENHEIHLDKTVALQIVFSLSSFCLYRCLEQSKAS